MLISKGMNKIFFIFMGIAFLFSCSPAKQIGKAAQKNVLNDAALKTAHVGISIYDAATGVYLYNYQGDKYFVPASNTKLFTCYAAMKYLRDSLVGVRYTTSTDTIFLQPTGDATFLHPDFKQQPVFDLLKQYSKIFIQKPEWEEAFLGSGWSWNDYKEGYMAQRSNFPIYGNIVKLLWKNFDSVQAIPSSFQKQIFLQQQLKSGFELVKPWDENKFMLLAGSTKKQEVPFQPNEETIAFLLADTTKRKVKIEAFPTAFNSRMLHSQPTDSLLKPMMHRSDNFFAEQALLMVSNEKLKVMNDAGIIDALLQTDFMELPQKPRWVDGSGLSRYNLFSPQDFVTLLNMMRTEFGMERIKNILATGNTGTLSNYYKASAGYIFAKTGTLSGVVAISGFLYTKKNRLLLFSVLVNNHQGSATIVRRAVEKFIEGIREKY